MAKLGVKTSLVVASVPYLLNILQLFTMNPGYIYFMAVMVGLSAPILWTALGTFLSHNSDTKVSPHHHQQTILSNIIKTINRNSGVFWAMNQSSTFVGSYYTFLALKGTVAEIILMLNYNVTWSREKE